MQKEFVFTKEFSALVILVLNTNQCVCLMYKVAILGPESTGKSELSRALADYFQTEWVPEYAREYVEQLAVPYTFEDVCIIAQKQIEQQQAFENNDTNKFVFFDTDLIITKVWFEYCYHQVPDFVQERLEENYFDFYLLCAPDLEWKPDPVREHDDDRDFFYNWYKREIEQTGKPFFMITGQGRQRTLNAIEAVNKAFKI